MQWQTIRNRADPTRRRPWRLTYGLVLLTAVAAPLQAQDMSTTALLLPRSGCALSATEAVRIRVVNYGPAPLPGSSFFSYAYSINNGPPVVEPVFMGNAVQPNGTLVYTFNTRADLSQPGIYQIDARITVSNDSNPANDALGAQDVRNWAPTVAGSVPPLPGTTTAGVLTLGGQLGEVLEWQQSEDEQRWLSLENTTDQQGFSGLARATQFRVQVQNGPCPPALTSSTRVAPDAILANGFEP